MNFKKTERDKLEEIIENLKETQIKRCNYCGGGLKVSKRREDEVRCTWKPCKKKYSL